MDIRHVRYFLAVADSGSVAAAARQLHIVQPALSRQIRDLEEELGAPLFSRSARGVELTAAGEQFALDARKLMIDFQSARQRALRVAQGSAGALRLGLSPAYGWHPAILSQINRFREAQPAISLRVEPMLAARQLTALADGELDGGFFGWRDARDTRFDAMTLFHCGLRIAVPKRGGITMQVPERLSDLAQLPCVWFDRDTAPTYYDFLIRQCQLAGFSPNIVQLGGDTTTILGLVAAGFGYSIVPDSALHCCPPSTALIAHPELTLTYPVEFVWKRDHLNGPLARFIRDMEPRVPFDPHATWAGEAPQQAGVPA
ncbi:LysR family transcriptional regulator [Burkholderia sp. Ac-20379]|uniref:LysR family transcriptional regulator n=1 Tax=Burkholderia sp. Ac-20379 TaxID=2703900 RepID=UPI00197EAEAF|nr:LysR family transcriptional regulator [Burkholderia sp. Ac-20379]MBN3727747.1 LysR family transcriptional regulator [Burkholderia sp. Ac-20379]